MNALDLGIRRILLASDVHRPLTPLIDAVAQLAATLDASLAALYVEDLDLIHSAALPFTREIGLLLQGNRPLDSNEVARSLRRDTTRVQQAIAKAAQRLNVPWTFRVEQGRLLRQLLELGGGQELVIAGAVATGGPNTDSIRSGPIVVVGSSSEAGKRSLEVATRLAAGMRCSVHRQSTFDPSARALRPSLVVVAADTSPDAKREIADLARLIGCGLVLSP